MEIALAQPQIDKIEIAPGMRVSRLAKGNWQLADKHGAPIDSSRAIDDMRAFVEAGITLFDCADHYLGVEALIGEFRRRHPSLAAQLKISTKVVPDQESLARVSREDITRIVDTSLLRLGVERLDLAQFHWWDYAVPGYLDAMHWLKDLQAAGKIAHLGTTNFDTLRLAEIVGSGVRVATNQLQYSVLDCRPENGMVDFCEKHHISLLCYGVLAGGFLSERWLGAPDPSPPFANRSLVKYRLIIEDFGGWPAFQRLLKTLDAIAVRHQVNLSSVAIRYLLDRPAASVAIVGARDASRLDATLEVFGLALDDAERESIRRLTTQAPGPIGDCYSLEREPTGPHNAIMWKNQNQHGVPADADAAYSPPSYVPSARVRPS